MSTTDATHKMHEASEDEPALDYRPVSSWAVLTVLLGLASALALTSPVLLVLPGVTLLCGLLAWRSISASEGALVGRTPVLWGIGLAAFFAATAVSRSIVERTIIDRDARQLADTFLHLLVHDEPQKAHQLLYTADRRQPPGVKLWHFYRTSPKDYDGLRQFVATPLARSLLALGRRATIRYYDTEEISTTAGYTFITQLFTVTYQEHGKRKTFFARVTVRRAVDRVTGLLDWSIDNYEAGVKPYVTKRS